MTRGCILLRTFIAFRILTRVFENSSTDDRQRYYRTAANRLATRRRHAPAAQKLQAFRLVRAAAFRQQAVVRCRCRRRRRFVAATARRCRFRRRRGRGGRRFLHTTGTDGGGVVADHHRQRAAIAFAANCGRWSVVPSRRLAADQTRNSPMEID